jgi:proliferating cell nuclear antigen
LKACGSDDVLSLRALEKADTLTLMFESAKQDRVSEYELKLMDVDAEQLSIPEMEYDCTFEMSSSEFRQIVTNMSAISETGMFVDLLFFLYYGIYDL